MRRGAFLAFAALLAGAACGRESAEPTAGVEQAWVRLPAAPDRPAAGYFRVETSGADVALLAVTSPSAERIELHRTAEGGGRARMEPIVAAPADREGRIVFAPGSAHLMLFGLDPALRPGGTIELGFRFRNAPPATAQARLVAAGDDPPHGGH